MKKGIHPDNYRNVVFKDMSNDYTFMTRSTVATKETIEMDGKKYPLVKIEILTSFLYRKDEIGRYSWSC